MYIHVKTTVTLHQLGIINPAKLKCNKWTPNGTAGRLLVRDKIPLPKAKHSKSEVYMTPNEDKYRKSVL